MIKLKEYSEIEDKTALDFGEDVRKMHQSEDYKDYVGFNFDEIIENAKLNNFDNNSLEVLLDIKPKQVKNLIN